MRAATRERMISIMAEAGLAGGLSANRKQIRRVHSTYPSKQSEHRKRAGKVHPVMD